MGVDGGCGYPGISRPNFSGGGGRGIKIEKNKNMPRVKRLFFKC
jgi:hypothetical protein